MSLRLLLVTDFYPPFLGGVELQTQLLAEELVRRGHAVAVATVWHAGLPEAEEQAGVAVRRLRGLSTRLPFAFSDPSRRRYHPPFPDPASVYGLRRLVRQTRPDVVDATGWLAYSARLAVVGTGVPLVLSARDFGYACPIRTFVRHGELCSGPGTTKCLRHAAEIYGPAKGLASAIGVLGLRRWLVRGAASVHVASRYVEGIERRDLLAGRDEGRMARIPDMVRTDQDDCAPPARGGDLLARLPDEPFLLFVGALQAHKGIGPLVEAYLRLRPRPPLVVVGTSWPDSPTSWPAGVTLLTDVPNPIVQAIWERSLFGVAPSLVPETFGGVVTEAMRSGKAMVASAIGGPLDTIDDGITGLLVPPGDAAALAAAMQSLIDDPALCERLGAAARRRVEELFATEVVVPQFEALYETVAARRGGDRS